MTTKQQAQIETLFTQAHELYRESLSSYAYFKVNNKMTCEDLVQNTFMKTWMYLKRGGKIEKMKAFLYHVLNNLIVDEYRKRKTVSLETLMEKGVEPAVVDTKNTVDVLDGKQAMMLIEELPSTYKNVLSMRFLEELTNEEMSEKTGLSKNTIAVQLHRGLEKLKVLCH